MAILHKISKAEAQYEHPAKGMEHCADCEYFELIAPDHCSKVQGIIKPEDWCKLFEEK